MESTIVIAKVLGVYFAISGIFIVTQRKTLGILLRDLFAHRATTFLVGLILLLGGTALVFSNDGADGLSVFIEIISWGILVKGILYILIPDWMGGIAKNISRTAYVLAGSVITIIGLYLVFFL